MSLVIKIEQNAILDFFTQFDPLTHLQKKIFESLQWWVRKFPNAHPRQEKIAKHVGCSRKHVNRTLKKFQEFGWIYLTSRGKKRTKIIGMCTYLVMMQLSKREYLKKLEVTSEVTHSSFSCKRITGKGKAASFCKVLEIAKHVKDLAISLKNKLKLSSIDECYYHKARETANARHKKKKFESNAQYEAYVVGTAVKMAMQDGKSIDWKTYYYTLNAMENAA